MNNQNNNQPKKKITSEKDVAVLAHLVDGAIKEYYYLSKYIKILQEEKQEFMSLIENPRLFDIKKRNEMYNSTTIRKEKVSNKKEQGYYKELLCYYDKKSDLIKNLSLNPQLSSTISFITFTTFINIEVINSEAKVAANLNIINYFLNLSSLNFYYADFGKILTIFKNSKESMTKITEYINADRDNIDYASEKTESLQEILVLYNLSIDKIKELYYKYITKVVSTTDYSDLENQKTNCKV